ncbi:MAG: DUF4168 domain-containing protein [Desulfobacteraceae bacterium]
MKSCKPLSIMFLFTIAIFIGGPGSALAGNNYDDVYENEVDKDTELTAEDIKKEDIKAFVEAAKEVQAIRTEYIEEISGAENEAYKDLRKEATGKMVEAIEDAGIDEATYRGIAYHVKKDDGLLSRIY